MKTAGADPKWLDSLTVPKQLKSSDYEYSGDRDALNAFKAVPGAAWFCTKWVEFWLEFRKSGFLGHAVKVSEKQFPEVNRLRLKCAEILHLSAPPVFIVEHPIINAYTMGTDDGNAFIGITRQLVETATEKELMFILGHEMGHVKSQHALYATIAIYLANLTLFGGKLPFAHLLVFPAEMALKAWFRRSEISCDRAGLLCMQDLDSGRKALLLLGCCSRELADRIDLEEFLNQGKESSNSYGKWSEAFLTHPYLPKRIRCLQTFAESHLMVRTIRKDSKSAFLDPDDLDAAVGQILGNEEPELEKTLESGDEGRLKVIMALAGAWSDGELSEADAKVVEGLIKKSGLERKEATELRAYLKKPFPVARAVKEMRYFSGDRVQGLPYAFSSLLLDAKRVTYAQARFLVRLACACGLDPVQAERIVYDVGSRKLFFRDKCAADICARCAVLYKPQAAACPSCGAKSTSLEEPDEKRVKRLSEKLGELGKAAGRTASGVAGGVLRTLAKGVDAAAEKLDKKKRA